MKKLWFFVVPIALVMILVKFQGVSANPLQAVSGFSYKGKNAQGLPEYTHQKTGIVFVRLVGGAFLMGSPANETGRSRDEKLHRVSLSPFLIAKYEVSQAQWKKVISKNPSFFRKDNHPVENIGWTEANRFVRASGLKLPTEAQWEYACRAGTTTAYSWGDTIAGTQLG